MVAKFNNAEGGTDGVSVTSANSATSGDAFMSPVNKGTTSVAATLTYSTAAKKNGNLGYRFFVGNTANVCNCAFSDAAATAFSMQGWYLLTAAPATLFEGPMQIRTSADSGINLIKVTQQTNRTLTLGIAAGQLGSATAALTLNTWYYLDFYGTGVQSGSATCTLDLYSAAGSLLSSVGGTGSVTGVPGRTTFGKTSTGGDSALFYMDDLHGNLGVGTAGGFPVIRRSDFTVRAGTLVGGQVSTLRSGVWV